MTITIISDRYALEQLETPDGQTYYEFARYHELDDKGVAFTDDFCLSGLSIDELNALALQAPITKELLKACQTVCDNPDELCNTAILGRAIYSALFAENRRLKMIRRILKRKG